MPQPSLAPPPRLAEHAADMLTRSRALFGGAAAQGAPPVAVPSDCEAAKRVAVQTRLARSGYRRVADLPAAPAAMKKARRDARAGLAPAALGPEVPPLPRAPSDGDGERAAAPAVPAPSTEIALINHRRRHQG